MFAISNLLKKSVVPAFRLELAAGFKWKPSKTPGNGYNMHKSNRAKEGLFHGKDISFGHSISHSHTRSNRSWKPNVQNKRLWSDALNDWVRFKVTTTALKAIDHYGGIDNYVLALDERSVEDSNYVTKVRGLIATALYQKGELSPKLVKQLKFDKTPPVVVVQAAK